MNNKAKHSPEETALERTNRALAYETATESIVLLENDGVLPLLPCRLALYGPGAQYTIKGGSGSGEVNVRHNITVLEGLEQAGFEIATHEWLSRYDRLWQKGKDRFLRINRRKLLWPHKHIWDELMAAEYRYPAGDPLTKEELQATQTDTCVYVLSRLSGEGYDRADEPGSFRITDEEIAAIKQCAASFERFVLVINTGAPIDLSPLDTISGVNAVVYMGQLGSESGRALASVLTGECSPSGRLAVTWPQTYADVPFGDEYDVAPLKAYYKEGIYVGYRYYDSFAVKPRYPFGFGLSYTSFALEPVAQEVKKDQVSIRVRVTNSGTRASKQVIQLYASCPGEDREYQRLVAYGKTETLAPGKSQEIELLFPIACLSMYDEAQAETILVEGDYLLRLGVSSRETNPIAALRLDKRVVLSRHHHLCAAAKPIAEMHHTPHFGIPQDLPVLPVSSEIFETQEFDYTDTKERFPAEVERQLQSLTANDYARFCSGTGMDGEEPGFMVPGAVGHTTSAYIGQGIPNAEMCDGPAGIRISKRAVLYPNGKIKPVDPPISVYEFIPGWLLRWFVLGNPEKGQTLYQFVTGWPIEAMIAQTWNRALVERVGRAVGAEMSEFGISFWLAPAMNIVRNPLCGRNYEYFSEDPLLSGQLAASITKGVQSTPGNYVTIKHLCANNQENSRQYMSSEVDERALREIYWKGFEIAVKESSPRAVMAAYNKVNGVYCPNSYELCTDLLRHEWSFDGIVMTDWFSTGDDKADEPMCIRAGVDIIMPGDQKVVKSLRKAYEAGILKESELRRACARLLKLLLNDKKQ